MHKSKNMRKASVRNNSENPLVARLMALSASLCFSVPTAFLVWLSLNTGLATIGLFLNSSYFLYSVGFCAAVALIAPNIFPSLLGKIWHGLISFERWLG
jgi:hypothetical protein